MLKLLAFDTSTDQLSVGVRHGDAVWSRQAPGGAQASSTLIPLVQALLAEAGIALRELDAICFGRGPGSFTGLRTACSVAQGLAYGADLPVLPVDTLHAVAEEARLLGGATRIVAVLDARMDEVYTAAFAFDGTPHPLGDAASVGECGLVHDELAAGAMCELVECRAARGGPALRDARKDGQLPADELRLQNEQVHQRPEVADLGRLLARHQAGLEVRGRDQQRLHQ